MDGFWEIGPDLWKWARSNPFAALLCGALIGTIIYFYTGIKVFQSGSLSPAAWMLSAWNSENDQEHGWAIFPIALVLFALRWREVKAAPKAPSNWGLLLVAFGTLAFVAGIRCVEARYTIVALPLLFLGFALFLFGPKVARIALFPCTFLLFMIPIGGLIQGTVGLQVFTGKVIHFMSNLCGIPVNISGTEITSVNGRFEPMEVAGGCSGIRSLMAMITLAALYAYFSMKGITRGLLLFASSLGFAVLGNFVRVFSVVLFAVFINPKRAMQLYHDYSGFVFFPVAVLAMVAFGNFLNRDWKSWWAKLMTPSSDKPDSGGTPPAENKPSSSGPVSYDY